MMLRSPKRKEREKEIMPTNRLETAIDASPEQCFDLSLSVDGAPLEDGVANGLSYEVGSAGLIEGLDSALLGLAAGESAEFDTALGGRGARAGATGRATVTVRSVRTKQLPTLDDTFAQEASEFDTLEELRGDLRTRLERVKRLEQGMQARDKVLESLLEKVEIPLPERTVEAEIEGRRDALEQQLAANGLDLDAYLASQDETLEAHEAHIIVDVERYRQRREHTVREIALRAARQVKMTGDAITLDAMQPFERRAIHLALEGDPEVTSSSIGEEPERRVVVGLRKPAAE